MRTNWVKAIMYSYIRLHLYIVTNEESRSWKEKLPAHFGPVYKLSVSTLVINLSFTQSLSLLCSHLSLPQAGLHPLFGSHWR